MMKRCSFCKVFQVIIEPFNVSFFGISSWSIDLDCYDIQWFALDTNREHSVIFEIAFQTLVDYEVIIEAFNLTFFSISGWGIDLDYCDIEWFAVEMSRDQSVIFEIASNTAFWTLLLTMMAIPFLLRDSCPQ